MVIAIITVFILGYAAIAFEEKIRVDKTASALLTGVLIWGIWSVWGSNAGESTHGIPDFLQHHLGEISEILFFLLGAMTIVELIDIHKGFNVITNRITTKDSRKLLWIITGITFFMSAALDNLTASIVMVSLLRKLIHNKKQRLFFAGMVVVAANAGGAWSPIGDVTTTMLWMGERILLPDFIYSLFIPSLVCAVVPLVYLSFKMKGEVERADYDHKRAAEEEKVKGSKRMLFTGVGALLFVPVFKQITHLPPYMGMLLGLGILWTVSELIHIDKSDREKKPFSAINALSRIDAATVLFFLGILLAIAGLDSMNLLKELALTLQENISSMPFIISLIGVFSAIVDNVPLVAASMGMFDYEMGHPVWEFLAYCAGTGGSLLIIGSAAGVAVMGMENVDFIWYVRKISLLALIGYVAGAITYMFMFPF